MLYSNYHKKLIISYCEKLIKKKKGKRIKIRTKEKEQSF